MKSGYAHYLRSQKAPLVFLCLITLSTTFAVGSYTFCLKFVYESLFNVQEDFLRIIILMASLLVVYFLLILGKQYVTSILKNNLRRVIQKDLTGEIMTYRYEYFVRRNTGEIIKRIVEDSGQIADGLYKMVLCAADIFIIAGWLVFFLLIAESIFFVFLSASIMFIAWALLWVNIIEHSSHDIGKEYSTMYKTFYEIMSGIKTIKFELLKHKIVREVAGIIRRLNGAFLKNTIFNNFLWNFNLILPWVVFILISYFGMKNIQSGALSPGYLVICLMMIWNLIEPLNDICGILVSLQEYRSARERIHRYRDGTSETGGTAEFPEGFSEISFENVTFSYADNAFGLSHLNFTVRRGEHLAIMGRTGCGKSTIAHLLIRLYDPQEGSISIDGLHISDMTLDSLRRNIVCVPQESRLYSFSLRENIDPFSKLNDEKIEALISMLGLDDLYNRLPHGLDTNIIKEGLDVSGGERQRIGLARALGIPAPVYIFDEITSSLDGETARLVLNAIYRMENATTISISHNPDILPYMDRIVVLNMNGCLVLDNDRRAIDIDAIVARL